MEFSLSTGAGLVGWAQTRNCSLHRYVQQAQYRICYRHFEWLSWARNKPSHHGRENVFESPLFTVDFDSVRAACYVLFVDLLRCVKGMALSVLFKFP